MNFDMNVIIGGVLGTICLIILVASIVFCFYKKRSVVRDKKRDSFRSIAIHV